MTYPSSRGLTSSKDHSTQCMMPSSAPASALLSNSSSRHLIGGGTQLPRTGRSAYGGAPRPAARQARAVGVGDERAGPRR
jgi:hypothetical protein